MTVTTHLRIAAGVCVLSTGFAVAGVGGAVAVADTASANPAGAAGTAGGSSQGSSAPGPAKAPKTIADLVRKQVQNGLAGIGGTLNSLPKPGQPSLALPALPKSTIGGASTVHGSLDTTPTSAPVAPAQGVPDALAAVNRAAAGAASQMGAAVSTAAVGAGQAASAAATAAEQAASGAAVMAADVVTTAADSVAAPVTQVVTSVQGMLSSVASAGEALSQVPTDLSDLLGVGATGQVTAGTNSRMNPPAAIVPVAAVGVHPPNPVLLLPEVVNAPVASPSVEPVMPLRYTAAQATRAATSAAAPSNGGGPADDVLSTVEHVIGAVVASVSLTALLAAALPGLAALLGTCAAGIRVGYRQAKTGADLPATAISRFVGSGPVGVVRSGSQVAWSPRVGQRRLAVSRPLRVVRPAAESAGLLDHAV